jgi:hypothetical protein
LIADPKEARSFISFLRGTFRSLDDPTGEGTSIASVGLGDSFGLVRAGGPDPGEGFQLDVVGSIFAQFDMGAPSNDLINADYVIGLPVTFRRNGFSIRAKLYHQSSHLGDEYLLRSDEIVRENLSFESIEFLASQELGALRVYAGAERIFRREPDTLPDSLFHTGVELRSGRTGKVQMLAGVDIKTTELHDWSPAVSARAGLELGRPGPEGHPGRLIIVAVRVVPGTLAVRTVLSGRHFLPRRWDPLRTLEQFDVLTPRCVEAALGLSHWCAAMKRDIAASAL